MPQAESPIVARDGLCAADRRPPAFVSVLYPLHNSKGPPGQRTRPRIQTRPKSPAVLSYSSHFDNPPRSGRIPSPADLQTSRTQRRSPLIGRILEPSFPPRTHNYKPPARRSRHAHTQQRCLSRRPPSARAARIRRRCGTTTTAASSNIRGEAPAPARVTGRDLQGTATMRAVASDTAGAVDGETGAAAGRGVEEGETIAPAHAHRDRAMATCAVALHRGGHVGRLQRLRRTERRRAALLLLRPQSCRLRLAEHSPARGSGRVACNLELEFPLLVA